MNGFLSVFKRELKGYFATPLAYIFMTIFLVWTSVNTLQNGFFDAGTASLRTFFADMPWLLLALVPAIAMRLWAEERRSKSIELLFSLPITTVQAVMAKFLAAWAVMILALILTWSWVVTVAYLGDPDWGPIITGYVGCVLLAGVYLAIGSFFSSISRNQVIAFILTSVVCGVFYIAGSPVVLEFVGGISPKLVDMVEVFSFQSRFESIMRGVVEIRDLGFFILLIAGWLWANMVILEERKAA